MPRSDRNPAGTGGAAAQSRRDDRSGLIDIRALSSLVDAQRSGGPTASASSLALPSFTNPWTMQDTRAPKPETRPQPITPAAGPDNRPLYVMIASLTLAVASLGAYVMLRPSPPNEVVVERAVVTTPTPEPSKPEPAAVAGEGEGEAEAEAKTEEAEAKAEEAEAKAEEAEAKAQPARDRKNPRGHRPKPKPKVDPEPPPKKKDTAVSVECVLDPKSCNRGSSKSLPATPSAAQIRDAMAAVKPQAKACGSRHGGHTGDKVRVKLSAKGSTGAITSAQALDDHKGTALGRCVAQALSKAKLPRFSKSQAGIVYAIRL